MSLVLLSSELKNYEVIKNSLKNDVHSLTLNKFETPASAVEKLNDFLMNNNLTQNEINKVCFIFDNTNNKIPLFEFTQEEIDSYNSALIDFKEYKNNIIDDENGLIANISRPLVHIPQLSSSFRATENIYSENFESFKITLFNLFTNISDIEVIYNKGDLTAKNTPLVFTEEDINDGNITEYFNQDDNHNVLSLLLFPRVISTQIFTPDDLYALMTTTVPGDLAQSYTLMNDIDMSDYTFGSESIGKLYSNSFTGNFNGNGYTITIDSIVSGYIGLFGTVINGTVENLNLVYKTMSFNLIDNDNPNLWIGGLCGYVNEGIFEYCNVTYLNDTEIIFDNSALSPISKPMFMGGAFGAGFGFNINNCNLITKGNFDIRVDDYVINDFSQLLMFIGGFIGALYSSTQSSFTDSSCIFEKATNLDFKSSSSISRIGRLNIAGVVGHIEKNNSFIIDNLTSEFKDNLNIGNNAQYLNQDLTLFFPTIYLGGVFGSIRPQNGTIIVPSEINNCRFIFRSDIFLSFLLNYSAVNIGLLSATNEISKFENIEINISGDIISNVSRVLDYISGTPPSINFGLLYGLGSRSFYNNINVNAYGIYSNIRNNYGSSYMGVIFGLISSPPEELDDISNITINCRDVGLYIDKTNTNPLSTLTRVTSFGGIVGLSLNRNFKNISLNCNNLSFGNNDNIEVAGIINSLHMGSLFGLIDNLLINTIENCNVNINQKYENINVVKNDNSNRVFNMGGIIGTVDNCIVNNCVAVINQYNQINSGIIDTNSQIDITNGGTFGLITNSSVINNCSVFFGENTNIENGTTTYLSSFVGGVIGNFSSGTITNCVAVYNDYSIKGATSNATIASGGPVTSVKSITYGTPITGSDVTDIDIGGINISDVNTDAIIAIFDLDNNSKWLAPLLKFRQSIEPQDSSSIYLSDILTDTVTTTSLFFRNYSFQNSMNFRVLPSVETTYEVIESSLVDSVSGIPPTKKVFYNTKTLDLKYDLNTNGTYFLLDDNGIIKKDSKFYNYESFLPLGTSLDPPGVFMIIEENPDSFEFVGLNDIYQNTFKNLGIGSVLLETPPPTPPTPDDEESNNWWWITILIVIVVILLMILIGWWFGAFDFGISNFLDSLRNSSFRWF